MDTLASSSSAMGSLAQLDMPRITINLFFVKVACSILVGRRISFFACVSEYLALNLSAPTKMTCEIFIKRKYNSNLMCIPYTLP
jgi:hypothetical protein